MGQYHIPVSLSAREFIDPHKLGYGLKQWEQVGFMLPIGDILYPLLVQGTSRGGGDFDKAELDPEGKYLGRWHGHRIAVIGDYAAASDLAPEFEADEIYSYCRNAQDRAEANGTETHTTWDGKEEMIGPDLGWRDITDEIIPIIEKMYKVRIHGSGWKERAFDPEEWGWLIKGWSEKEQEANRRACHAVTAPA